MSDEECLALTHPSSLITDVFSLQHSPRHRRLRAAAEVSFRCGAAREVRRRLQGTRGRAAPFRRGRATRCVAPLRFGRRGAGGSTAGARHTRRVPAPRARRLDDYADGAARRARSLRRRGVARLLFSIRLGLERASRAPSDWALGGARDGDGALAALLPRVPEARRARRARQRSHLGEVVPPLPAHKIFHTPRARRHHARGDADRRRRVARARARPRRGARARHGQRQVRH